MGYYIDSEELYRKANIIVDKCGTRNTLKIARELGIQVDAVDYFTNLLGFYTYRWKIRQIYYNNSMNSNEVQMVVGHEVGHDVWHRSEASTGGFKEFEIFHMRDPKEYEANAFNAHLIIDTDEYLRMAKYGYDIYQIASAMNTEVNMILIKANELIKLGYRLRLPEAPQGDFLKNVKVKPEWDD